jgi:hypothetical protein
VPPVTANGSFPAAKIANVSEFRSWDRPVTLPVSANGSIPAAKIANVGPCFGNLVKTGLRKQGPPLAITGRSQPLKSLTLANFGAGIGPLAYADTAVVSANGSIPAAKIANVGPCFSWNLVKNMAPKAVPPVSANGSIQAAKIANVSPSKAVPPVSANGLNPAPTCSEFADDVGRCFENLVTRFPSSTQR